jgi:hypothetical protein
MSWPFAGYDDCGDECRVDIREDKKMKAKVVKLNVEKRWSLSVGADDNKERFAVVPADFAGTEFNICTARHIDVQVENELHERVFPFGTGMTATDAINEARLEYPRIEISQRAIVIGRHEQASIEGVEIIDRRAVTFPATADECAFVLTELFREATEKEAAILFQNIPGQLAVCLAQESYYHGRATGQDRASVLDGIEMGVIISKPGPRPEKVVTEQFIGHKDEVDALQEFLRRAGSRSTVTLSADGHKAVITSTPPMRFEFSHIEWM